MHPLGSFSFGSPCHSHAPVVVGEIAPLWWVRVLLTEVRLPCLAFHREPTFGREVRSPTIQGSEKPRRGAPIGKCKWARSGSGAEVLVDFFAGCRSSLVTCAVPIEPAVVDNALSVTLSSLSSFLAGWVPTCSAVVMRTRSNARVPIHLPPSADVRNAMRVCQCVDECPFKSRLRFGSDWA